MDRCTRSCTLRRTCAKASPQLLWFHGLQHCLLACPAETSGSEDDQLDIPPLQAQSDSDAAEDVECVPCDPSYADEPVDDPGEFPW